MADGDGHLTSEAVLCVEPAASDGGNLFAHHSQQVTDAHMCAQHERRVPRVVYRNFGVVSAVCCVARHKHVWPHVSKNGSVVISVSGDLSFSDDRYQFVNQWCSLVLYQWVTEVSC